MFDTQSRRNGLINLNHDVCSLRYSIGIGNVHILREQFWTLIPRALRD